MFALRRVRDHIDRHSAEPLTLTGLAALSGMSRFHLVRAFQAAYGETPMRYLSRRRIARAQELLRYANLTVTEVCMAVGFASLGSFSSRFRALVGESPRAYQRRYAAGAPRIPGCWLFMHNAIPEKSSHPVRPSVEP
ncbi:helix-turn-helix domain-containing protein [Paractinoplanes lichenicola]|uniref:Helix-turn-helix transcriptional regulator n=1 Tax=Paractinoplanes lichenicola TaxID=2802976 RepID=A0ABS1W3B1_9ACTN|nr:helix-turn-helix transcriptional regulator [Actinoplanes lichenicola]MBL7261208.1 helix-turn-helix transcriptional regulator [Actinoplanes lichenicola]